MKTNRIIIAALFISAAVSCQKEGFGGSENARETESATIVAGEMTRTSLNGNEVHWTSDDVIAVYDNFGYKNEFNVLKASASYATFSGEVTSGTTKIYAVYPYELAGAVSGSTVNVTIPVDQTSKVGSFAEEHNISVAKGTKNPGVEEIEDITFKNVVSYLKFTIPSYIEDAKSVTFSTTSRAIAGSATVDASAEVPVATAAENASNSVKMTGSYPAGSQFMFVLTPGNIQGFTVTVVTDKTTWTITRSSEVSFAPGQYKNLGTLELEQVGVTATADHTYSGNTLTGTTVSVSLNIPTATQQYASDLELVVVRNADGAVVRSASNSTLSSSVTLAATQDWPYLPQGTYTVSGSYKLGETMKTISTTFVSPEPTFVVTSGAYTSYTKYKAGSASAANSCDAETIYDVTSAAVSISDAIMNNGNYSSLKGGYTYKVDGTATTSATVGGQSWEQHTVTAAYTFDGVAISGSTDCHITGLPYKSGVPSNEGAHPWRTILENVKWGSSYVELTYAAGKSPTIATPTFHIPSDINVNIASKLERNKYVFLFSSVHGPYRIGRSTKDVIAGSGTKQVTDCIVDIDVKSEGKYEDNANGTMTTTYNCWYVQYAYWAGGPVSYLYYFNINYR